MGMSAVICNSYNRICQILILLLNIRIYIDDMLLLTASVQLL